MSATAWRNAGNDAQPLAMAAASAMSAGEAASAAMSAGEAASAAMSDGEAMSAGEATLAAKAMGNEGSMAVMHSTIVPAVVIVASIMVPIAAHKPERVQVAVVIVIGVAVVAVAVRVVGPRLCTSRQGDTDAKHQT